MVPAFQKNYLVKEGGYIRLSPPVFEVGGSFRNCACGCGLLGFIFWNESADPKNLAVRQAQTRLGAKCVKFSGVTLKISGKRACPNRVLTDCCARFFL